MQSDSQALSVLLGAAVTIAAGHTLIGVDHSLPFIALGRARKWSLGRLLAVTAVCGTGHVLSSVALGFVGLALGTALDRMQWLEATRGSIAAYMLIGFGVIYAARAWLRMQRGHAHTHDHSHAHQAHAHEGHAHDAHAHLHDHRDVEHMHPHEQAGKSSATIWALFVVFAFGPCEPLIPLVMAPAALHRWHWVVLVTAVFGLVTIAVMMLVVAIGFLGLSRLRLTGVERYADVLAGLTIACSGIAIQAFGI